MKRKYKILGIDLGACMSGNSAYIYAEVSENKIDIIEHYKEPKHKDHLSCKAYIIAMIERFNDLDAIAIDAPLSLPRPLLDPSFSPPPRSGNGEILNPYLFRYTDYYLYKTFKLRPMPPAGDRIGRLTARSVEFLHHFNYIFPHILIKGRQCPIYEVYPKQIAQALNLSDYKKNPDAVLKHFQCDADFDEHLSDALLCVYAGAQILEGHSTAIPVEAQNEGWCFPV